MKDYLNPGDFLLWLSEEIETRDWDAKHFGTPLALGLHIIFLVSRANSGNSNRGGGDDVFGDDYSGTGWFSYIVRYLPEHMASGTLTYIAGNSYGTSPDLPLYCKRCVYLYSKTALPVI
jgi:hypothetical protein